MYHNVVSPWLLQAPPLLQSHIHRLLPVSNPLLHKKSFLWVAKACRTLHMHGMLPLVSIIRLNPLILLQKAHQRISKYLQIIECVGNSYNVIGCGYFGLFDYFVHFLYKKFFLSRQIMIKCCIEQLKNNNSF